MDKGYSDNTIMIVDDDETFANSCHLILEKEGYHAVVCSTLQEVAESVRGRNIHVVLLDYFMSGVSPAEVIDSVRKRDHNIQVILQTGYSKEIPPRDVLKKLDIQGYHDKSDGPERMLMWVEMALKSYHHLNAMEKSKEGLRYILKITPQIYKMQSLQDLLKGTLLQLIGLLDGEHGFLATVDLKSFATHAGGIGQFEYQVGVGRFADKNCIEMLDDEDKEIVNQSIKTGKSANVESVLVVPLVLRERVLGIIYLETFRQFKHAMELLLIFANQIAIAIENTILYELATIDSLTKLYVKGYLIQRLREEIRSSYRYNYPLLLLILDIDLFKKINDNYGHQFGDYVLSEVAQSIKISSRETDIACRYGGDEFAVILPHTDPKGGHILAERIRRRISENEFTTADGKKVKTTISIGVSYLDFENSENTKIIRSKSFFEDLAYRFIEYADNGLYKAKNSGRNKICESDVVPLVDEMGME